MKYNKYHYAEDFQPLVNVFEVVLELEAELGASLLRVLGRDDFDLGRKVLLDQGLQETSDKELFCSDPVHTSLVKYLQQIVMIS